MDADLKKNNRHTLLRLRSSGKTLVWNPAIEKQNDKGLSYVLKYYKKDFWPSFSKGSYPCNYVTFNSDFQLVDLFCCPEITVIFPQTETQTKL